MIGPHQYLLTCDTNVLVSGVIRPSGTPGSLVDAWRKDEIDIAVSPFIIEEVRDVLSRPYMVAYGWIEQDVDELVSELTTSGVCVAGTTPVDVCRDPKDNMVFACALEAKSDFIVSGDKDVLAIKVFEDIPVVTPRECVEFTIIRPKQAA